MRHHSFDTRGFLVGCTMLATLVSIVGVAKFSFVFAEARFMKESNTAASAAVATPTQEEVAEPIAPAAPSITVATPAPKVAAIAYVVANIDTGEVYAEKNSDTPYPIASISKLLVALATRATLSPESKVTITQADRAQTEGSPGSIQRDETFTVKDLYYPLLMESNNSVAYALERAGGGEEFVRVMLRIAHSAGMDETLLNDSSGLSPRNRASAHDLFSLSQHILENDPQLFETTRTASKSVTALSGRTYPIPNLNIFTADEAFIGGKTGYTDEAKQTMLTIFELPVKNQEKPARIAIIILGSHDRKGDIEKLKNWFSSTASAR